MVPPEEFQDTVENEGGSRAAKLAGSPQNEPFHSEKFVTRAMSDTRAGLSSLEAAARLARIGHNELPSTEHRSVLALALEVIREPMFALLVGAAALYAAIGDLGEALLLGAFATVSVSIAIVQRGRSER